MARPLSRARASLAGTRTALATRAGLLARPGESVPAEPPPPVRTYVQPRWLVMHVLVLGAAIAMIFLGRWQLDVSNSKHFDLQNFGYAFQWWAFSAFAFWLWFRIVRDSRRRRTSAPGDRVTLVPGQGQTDDAPFVGPADLIAWPRNPDEAPIVYRGYVPPQSATSPPHSEGDGFHASYNDYLWKLAMADAAGSKSTAANPIQGPDVEGGEPPRAVEG